MMKFLLLFVFAFFSLSQASEVVWEGEVYNDDTVSELITVIISTSPIPSMPSTKHLYEAQKSLFLVPTFAKCKKIIVFDGLKKENAHLADSYNEYKDNVAKLVEEDPYFSNTELVFCEKWGHLSGALKEAVRHVGTPFIFVHQHDLVLLKEFDVNGVVATMVANPRVKCVFLGRRINTPDDFYHKPIVERVQGETFVPLCRSGGWSDQEHVTTLKYYTNFVLPQCQQTFMERKLHKALRAAMYQHGWAGHAQFGTYMYGKLGDGGYYYHSDGRHN